MNCSYSQPNLLNINENKCIGCKDDYVQKIVDGELITMYQVDNDNPLL